MELRDSCQRCGSIIERVTALFNGDELVFARCYEDGFYAVSTSDLSEAVTVKEQPCDCRLTTGSVKLDNGDRVDVEYCERHGFYAMDPDEQLVN